MQDKIKIEDLTNKQIRMIVNKTGNFRTHLLTPYCLGCGYNLEGVDAACPECGRVFDINDEATYSYFPPKDELKYWTPVHILTAASLILSFFFLWIEGHFGFTLFLVLPGVGGLYLGYNARGKSSALVLAALLAFTAGVGLLLTLIVMDISGLFCAIIAGMLLFGPFIIGIGLGALTRLVMRSQKRFSQRWYLFPLMIAAMPWLFGVIENWLAPISLKMETVQRSFYFEAERDQVYQDFIQSSQGPIPATGPIKLLMPTVKHLAGPIKEGEIRTTTFNKIGLFESKSGEMAARLHTIKPGELIAFSIVRQSAFENKSVTLQDGYYKFDDIRTANGKTQTRLTFSVTYEPKLRARWIWRPLERLVLKSQYDARVNAMSMTASGG